MMAGMCGFKKDILKHIGKFQNIIDATKDNKFGYLTDQIILANFIYKKYIN